MLVPKEIIQEIKARLDIIDVTKAYLGSLKKVGKNWMALCPFHNDHHPSLHVSSDMGIFKCFSCGEGGDLISFIQKIENISFNEAVKFLAKKAGIEIKLIEEGSEEKHQKREEILQFNNRLINLFQFFLLKRSEGKKALNYLLNRGVTKDLIDIFKIGYAPRGDNNLTQVFLKKGFKEEFLISAGILNKTEKGLRPFFFDRIIFPIVNHNEECIGFGGRTLSDEIKPKYLNTPETILYKKSYSLYGINIAKPYIRETKKVFIVEGYMDVIGCYKNGIKNVVAPCGTAITNDQINIINRYTDEIIFLMDGDEAGKKGAEKGIRESAKILTKKSVLVLPEEMDPDDYFKKYSINDFNELEKNKIDVFDFLVTYKTNDIKKGDYKKLTNALDSLFEYINLEDNEIIRNSFIERLAVILEIDKGVIAREFITYKNKRKYSNILNTEKENEKDKNKINDRVKREIDLILLLLQIDNNKELIKYCGLREEHFSIQYIQDLFKEIFNESFSLKKKDFMDYIDDNSLKEYMQARVFSDEFKQNENVLRNNVIDRIIDIIKRYYKSINKDINEKIKLGELYKDNDLVRKFQEEKTIIVNEIIKLSKLQELKNNGKNY